LIDEEAYRTASSAETLRRARRRLEPRTQRAPRRRGIDVHFRQESERADAAVVVAERKRIGAGHDAKSPARGVANERRHAPGRKPAAVVSNRTGALAVRIATRAHPGAARAEPLAEAPGAHRHCAGPAHVGEGLLDFAA